MQPAKRLNKSDERKLMRQFQDIREKATPLHRDPAWMHRFWARLCQ